MSKQDQILQELGDLPEAALDEVLNFVRSLSKRAPEGLETAVASESALRKIWLTPEEDEAWANL